MRKASQWWPYRPTIDHTRCVAKLPRVCISALQTLHVTSWVTWTGALYDFMHIDFTGGSRSQNITSQSYIYFFFSCESYVDLDDKESENMKVYWSFECGLRQNRLFMNTVMDHKVTCLFFCFNFLRFLYGMFPYSNTHSIEQCRGKNEMRWSEFP